MFYLITVVVATVVIALANAFSGGQFGAATLGHMFLQTLSGVAAVFAIDAICAFVIRRMPEKWFAPEAKAFGVGKRERALYRKTGINKWKAYVPEWGCFTGFHKDKLRDRSDSAYIGRFLTESNYGVAGHIAGALAGFSIMLLPFLRPFAMALPIAAVNFILSILPTAILRFNTPALRGLYRKSAAREQAKKEGGS